MKSLLQVPPHKHEVAVVFSVSPHDPPVAVTVAILLLFEVQTNFWFVITLPLLSMTWAVTACTSPNLRETELVGVIVMLVGVTGVLLLPQPAIPNPRRRNEIAAKAVCALNDDETHCRMHPPRFGALARADQL